jgi:glycosyltransferase involved in cell wall biosynthesis
MRIVHYLNHSCRGNGHVCVAVDLACEQVRTGHDVYMVSGFGDFDDVLTANGVKVVTLGEASGRFKLFKMMWRLLPALRRLRPDVVNAHMVYAAIVARLIRPLVGYRLVTTVHNSFDRQSSLMRVGDRVIVVSDAVGVDMRRRGIAPAKLRTVTNGTIGGVLRPPYRGTPELLRHPAVVTVCGLHSRKGVAHLIDGFDIARRTVPDAQLYLVGGGPEQADFEARARATDSGDHIHFLGYREDPRDVLASADLFVLASLRDPCPLVIFEAQEMGNPIIASAVDGIPAALGEGRRGVLVRPADPDGLAREMVRVLTDPELRARLSRASQENLENITVRRVSSQTVAVYAEALQRGTAPSKSMQLSRP